MYALRSPSCQSQIAAVLNTTVQATLNLADLKRIRVPMPRSATRHAIAEVLGALDDKIAANEQVSHAVDRACQALFAGLEQLASAPLSSIAVVNDQVTKPDKGQLRYLDISSVGVGRYGWPEVIAWADAPSRARRVVRPGDTVWSTVRPNRRSHALVLDDDPELVGSTGLAVITPAGAGPAFVYEATKTPAFTSYLEGVAEGSAYPAVRGDRFLEAPVPAASLDERERFEKVAYPARARAHSAHAESRRLATLRDTLLPHLMSGRITVREAEQQVEEVL